MEQEKHFNLHINLTSYERKGLLKLKGKKSWREFFKERKLI
jgi:hypothetical protein